MAGLRKLSGSAEEPAALAVQWPRARQGKAFRGTASWGTAASCSFESRTLACNGNSWNLKA